QVLPQVISAFQSFLEKVFSVPPGSFDGLSTAFEAVLEVVKGTVETVENAVSWFQKGGPAVDVLTTAIVAI
ncbi:hypothetical protein ACP3WI_25285, partial [Salmonella enterica]|uniref:hypothetical protein n=1 Tax=Salmonella enterica TaxID=28901 RepID=UPI003CF17AD5